MGLPTAAEGRSSDARLGPRAQRTVDLILETTRAEFLVRGYGGTRIDDIARSAGISRASFYTYFRSKRDVLVALAEGVVRSEARVVRALGELGRGSSRADIEGWVRDYFRHLDEHGGVVLVWDQAVHDEDDLLELGNRAKARSWHRVGTALAVLRGELVGDATVQGMLFLSMLDGAWMRWRLGKTPFGEEAIVANVAASMAGRALRGVSSG